MTSVLITRPQPAAGRTLRALRARGISAEVISLNDIVPLAFDRPKGSFDGLIVTSQNGLIHSSNVAREFLERPVFAVGQKTADLLIGQGFKTVVFAETAQALVPRITEFSSSQLLYVCGKTRKPDLELGLTKLGIFVEALEVYATSPRKNAGHQLLEYFSAVERSIVLLYSANAAETFVSLMQGHDPLGKVRFLCLSPDVAAQLPKNWHFSVALAERPHQAALFDQLDMMLADKKLAQDHMPKA